MGIKEFIQRNREKKNQINEIAKELRIQKLAEDRLKSANERELERFNEENRQKLIKENLKKFREMRKREIENMKIIGHKNIFKGHKNILSMPNTFKINKSQNMFLK